MTTSWPQDRPFPFSKHVPSGELVTAWEFSQRRISDVARVIESLMEPTPACVAVSGSLSRMEGHELSDLDLLIVVDDRDEREVDAEDLHRRVWRALEERLPGPEVERPTAGGIFSRCVSWKDVTNLSRRGVVDEDIDTFGHRIQLLIDSQPVTGSEQYVQLQREILDWYREDRIRALFGESSTWHWLWQDVQRYWRSLRSRSCWIASGRLGKSMEINLKLRSSRQTLVAAFLHTLDRVGMTDGCDELILEALYRTPVERLADASTRAAELVGAYENLWARCRELNHFNSGAHDVTPEISDADRQIVGQLAELTCEAIGSKSLNWIL